MELYQLSYFVEVARQRNFTRAAVTLGIAQPALSQQMLNLEQELGAPLLVRGRREFALRDVGDVEIASLLGDALRQFYHDAGFVPDEILVPELIDQDELTGEWLRALAGRVG